jgi:hypothetical protein
MTIVNLHALIISAPNFIKHTLLDLKTERDPNTVNVGDSNTPLSPIERSLKQKKKNQQNNPRIE